MTHPRTAPFLAPLRAPTLLLASLLLLIPGTGRADAPPRVGAAAPDWVFHGVEGSRHRAADLLGRQGVVVAWFPKAFTPGCTTELANLRDHAGELSEYDVRVLYVSLDPPEDNAAFAESLGAADVLVVSDPEGRMAERFGVIAPGGRYARRWTFFIDAEGIVRAIDQQVDPDTAGQDILATLERLDFPKRMSTVPDAPARSGAGR